MWCLTTNTLSFLQEPKLFAPPPNISGMFYTSFLSIITFLFLSAISMSSKQQCRVCQQWVSAGPFQQHLGYNNLTISETQYNKNAECRNFYFPSTSRKVALVKKTKKKRSIFF
jgi:hypothetical protein